MGKKRTDRMEIVWRTFTVVYLFMVLYFLTYDLYVGTWWALVQLVFLPIAMHWFVEAWWSR